MLNHTIGDYAKITEPVENGFKLYELVRLTGIYIEDNGNVLYKLINNKGVEKKVERMHFQWIRDL